MGPIIVSSLLAALATASPTPIEPPPVLSGQANISYVASSSTGYSSSSASGTAELTFKPVTCTLGGPVNRYEISFKAGQYKTVNGGAVTSLENDADLRGEVVIHRGLRGFIAEVYYRDPFSGFEHQLATENGILFHAIKSDAASLQVSCALAPTWQDRSGDTPRWFLAGDIGAKFSFEVDDTITVEQAISYSHGFSGPPDLTLKSSTDLTVLIYKRMFGLKLSHWLSVSESGQGKPRRSSYLTVGGTFEFPAKPKSK